VRAATSSEGVTGKRACCPQDRSADADDGFTLAFGRALAEVDQGAHVGMKIGGLALRP